MNSELENEARKPEGGAIGTAQFKSYTGFLTIVAYLEGFAFVSYDQGQGGPHYLNIAFGIQATWWIWACMFAGWFITLSGSSVTSVAYTQFTGLVYTEDRRGFAKSGGQDIGIWGGFFSFVVTLYVFTRFIPAGTLGIARPFLILAITGVLTFFVTRTLSVRVFSALYKPHKINSVYIRRIQCKQTFLYNQKCQYPTYGDTELCRWHKILHEFRDDNRRGGYWVTQGYMAGVGFSFTIAITCFWFYSKTPEIVWLPVILFAVGSGLTWFADSIMAQDYPLSQFAFWAKLLTTGLVFEVIGGIALIAYMLAMPQAAHPVVSMIFGNGSLWATYGPPLIVILTALFTIPPVSLLIHRIFFFRAPYLRTTLWILTLSLVGWVFQPLLLQLGPFRGIIPQIASTFWEVVLGKGNSSWPIIIAYFVSFMVCEFINVSMRRGSLDSGHFQKTVSISYPVCTLSPIIALFAGRYLLFWLGIAGVVQFVLATTIIAVPLCIIGTRWITRRYR